MKFLDANGLKMYNEYIHDKIYKRIISSDSDVMYLSPNIYYINTNDSLSNLTIHINQTECGEYMTEYILEFTTSKYGTYISLPDNIKLIEGTSLKLENNTNYIISIVNNICDIIKVSNKNKNDIILNNYLTIEALEDLYIYLGTPNPGDVVEYCINADGVWKPHVFRTSYIVELEDGGFTTKNESFEIKISQGDTISFKAELKPTRWGIGRFDITEVNFTSVQHNAEFNVVGDCMSLLFGDEARNIHSLEGYDYAFYELFRANSGLRDISNIILKATTLSKGCYCGMFRECTNYYLEGDVQRLNLPAMNLAPYCYEKMFYDARVGYSPILRAPILKHGCYRDMFGAESGISRLERIIILATDCDPDTTIDDCLEGCVPEKHPYDNDGIRKVFFKHPDMDINRLPIGEEFGEGCIPESWIIEDYIG